MTKKKTITKSQKVLKKDLNSKKKTVYLTDFRVISSQYRLNGDRQMTEKEAEKFQKDYAEKMQEVAKDKKVIDKIAATMLRRKADEDEEK